MNPNAEITVLKVSISDPVTAINFFSEGSRKSLYRREGSEDWFNRRQRPNGSTYEIVDNPYEETDLRRILEPHAKDLVYKTGERFFWITYQIT